MPTVHLTGRVLPSTVNISITSAPTVNSKEPDIDLQMAFTVRIVNSSVDVECEVNRFQPDESVHLIIRALDVARLAVDLVAFATGYGLTVVLDALITPTGDSTPILFEDLRLAPLCSAFQVNATTPAENADFGKMYRLALSEPGLFIAL